MGVKIVYSEATAFEETPAVSFSGTSSSNYPVMSSLSGVTPYVSGSVTAGYTLLNTLVIQLTWSTPQRIIDHSALVVKVTGDAYPTRITQRWTGLANFYIGSTQFTTLSADSWPTQGGDIILDNPARRTTGQIGPNVTYTGITIEIPAISVSRGALWISAVQRGLDLVWTDTDMFAELALTESADPVGLSLPYDISSFEVEQAPLSTAPRVYGGDPIAVTPRFSRLDRLQYYYTSQGEPDKWLGEHYIDSVKHSRDRYAFSAVSALGVLADTPYPGGTYLRHRQSGSEAFGTLWTWYEVLRDVLGDGPTITLDSAYTGANAYIDRWVCLPPGNVRDALSALACALGACIRSNGWGITMAPLAATDDPLVVDPDTIFGGDFDRGPEVSTVAVTKYSLISRENPETVYSQTLKAGQHRLMLKGLIVSINSDMYSVTGATATIPDGLYTYYLDVTVDADDTAVTVTGRIAEFEATRTDEYEATDTYAYISKQRTTTATIDGCYMFRADQAESDTITARLVPYIMATPDTYTGRILPQDTDVVPGMYIQLTEPGSAQISGWVTDVEYQVRRNIYLDITIAGRYTEVRT